jgi:hypothetical protein
MQKRYWSLLLPLLMLLVQQGALWHEMGHGRRHTPSVATQPQQEQTPGVELCDSCLAFAQIASIAKTQVLALGLLCFGFAFAPDVAARFLAADAPPRRSRGPPFPL